MYQDKGKSVVFKAKCNSITFNGLKLFNILPKEIRNMSDCTLSQFKTHLDKFLTTVADEPQIPGYTKFRRTSTNSLLDMIPEFIESRRRLEDWSP